MSRRHDALIPLTHDHHHALKNARKLKQASDADPPGRLHSTESFIQFFRDHSIQHFREEEEEIFPLVIDHPSAPIDGISRILLEHVRLHALCKRLDEQKASGDVDPDLMRAMADQLRRHIRFEEDELFPAIEQAAAEQLARVRLGPRDREALS